MKRPAMWRQSIKRLQRRRFLQLLAWKTLILCLTVAAVIVVSTGE